MYISESDKAKIRQTIEQQLKAFQEDDADAAFHFASPIIQKQFGTSDNFMSMVKTHYQAVYRPRSVMFQGFTMVENFPAQTLILMDAQGKLIQAIYVMQQQLNYTWRIHGCFFVPMGQT